MERQDVSGRRLRNRVIVTNAILDRSIAIIRDPPDFFQKDRACQQRRGVTLLSIDHQAVP